MKRFFSIIVFVCIGLYPVLVYLGLQHYSPRHLILLLCFMVVVRYLMGLKKQSVKNTQGLLLLLGTLLIAVYTLASNSILGMKFYPVVISSILFLYFGFSLLRPPTVVEQIARIQEPDLPPEGVAYTRKVTFVWTLFFLSNGLIALYSCFYFTMAQWTLYNGLISYIVMGCLFTTEFLYRKLFLLRESN